MSAARKLTRYTNNYRLGGGGCFFLPTTYDNIRHTNDLTGLWTCHFTPAGIEERERVTCGLRAGKRQQASRSPQRDAAGQTWGLQDYTATTPDIAYSPPRGRTGDTRRRVFRVLSDAAGRLWSSPFLRLLSWPWFGDYIGCCDKDGQRTSSRRTKTLRRRTK